MASNASTIMITTLEREVPLSVWTLFQFIHTFLTVVALLINCVSLGVVYGLVTRLTPPLQLLTGVAFADMLAPWAVMTVYFPSSPCQEEIHSALLLTSHNTSVILLLGLAMVHYTATFRPFQYERIASQKRLWIIVNVVWILGILAAHTHFISILAHADPYVPFCFQVYTHTTLVLTMSVGLMSVCIFTTALIYARIFIHLRPLGAFANHNGEFRKSARGVVTGILLASSFVLTWIPYLIVKYLSIKDNAIKKYDGFFIGLNVCQVFILLNAATTPIIYGVRMSAMQMGYISLYHKTRDWVVTSWRKCTKTYEADELPSTPLNPIESVC